MLGFLFNWEFTLSGSFVYQILLTVGLFYLVRYVASWFAEEYTNIPSFTVAPLKVKGGFVEPNQKVMGEKEIISYNPATMEILGTAPVMGKEEVLKRIKKAREAQKEWSKTSFAERRRVLRTLKEFLVKNAEELSKISVLETGKTEVDSVFGEIFMSCGKLDYIINSGETFLSPERRPVGMMMIAKAAYVQYHPFGVIGLIIPWNFPIHNVLSHIGTALMGGNGCVVKVSEWASWSVIYMEAMTRALLKATGHNPDLIQFVTGYAEAGSTLVQNTDKVLFIGSPGVGKKVMEAAATADVPVPVTLELGGKDPFIVLDDADIDYTVDMALRGAWLNCGQNCLSAERFYVYDKVYDKFLAKVKEIAPKLQQGPSAPDVGAINMPVQLQKYQSLIDDAVKKGAKVLFGGKPNPAFKGHFFEPTVLINVNHSMEIMKEETFGPVMPIMKVTSDEDVVKFANDCRYGLSAAIFTSNYTRGYELAKKIQSGGTVLNDWGLSMMIQDLPFGGIKVSGFGKFNGPEGIRDFCFQKSFITDRFGIVMKAPQALMYPTSNKIQGVVFELIRTLHERKIGDKAAAAVRLVKKILAKEF